MKRRLFLKAGIGLGVTVAAGGIPGDILSGSEKAEGSSSYETGDQVAKEAFVHDRDLKKHHLVDLCSQIPRVKVNFLYIYGGGANRHRDRLGGLWCPDSFEDLHTLRFIDQKYDDSQVRILPVACAPVYSSQYYSFERRVFLDEPDKSDKFRESARVFVESTEEVIDNDFIPVPTYYDFRHRLLFNRREDLQPGDGYGKVFEWQGKFRGRGDTQKYGTPTVWLLDSNGKVLEEPFWGNYYHSEPFQIGYTIVDLDQAIQRHL